MVKRILLILSIIFFSGLIGLKLAPYLHQFFLSSGVIQEKILIAGTGSMYPTFPKGEGGTDVVRAKEIVGWPMMRRYPAGIKILNFNLFPYTFTRGDIVEFENQETKKLSMEKYGEEAGFIKRVIGLPGDIVEFRDGFLYRNGLSVDEPYIAKPRSTYGGSFLADCKKLTIPDNRIFVLGDNRKASLDSRFELGLVNFSDIHYFIPWNKQEEYKKNWRETKDDLFLAHTATLDHQVFMKLLNDKRKEKSLTSYKYHVLLTNAAKIRGYAMIRTNDFSIEATKSGVNLSKSMEEAGYSNIVTAELSTRGFYEAEELLDNLMEFPEGQKILYSTEYQDIGLAIALGEVDSCPVQVVVLEFGGYKPPNYTKLEIDSWQKLVDNLESALINFGNLKTADNINQGTLDQLLYLLNARLSNARKIVTRMRANQWLTKEEIGTTEEDRKLGEEAEKIISDLMKK